MCLHNMVNFGLLAAEIVSLVWGTQLISTAFASWLRYCSVIAQRKPTKLCTNFANFGPYLGRLVDYIYIFVGCCSVTEFCQVQNSLCILQVLRAPIRSVTARQSSSGREPNFAALSTGRHLYSAGRPSGWALAHILVFHILLATCSCKFGTCKYAKRFCYISLYCSGQTAAFR